MTSSFPCHAIITNSLEVKHANLPVSNTNKSSNQPDMWLRPPNKYNFVPTATNDAAERGGGRMPVTRGWDHLEVAVTQCKEKKGMKMLKHQN